MGDYADMECEAGVDDWEAAEPKEGRDLWLGAWPNVFVVAL